VDWGFGMTERTKSGQADETPQGLRTLPTIYADRVFVNYWADHLKISFAERIDGVNYYRSSVVMEANDIKRLAKILQEVLDEWKTDEVEPKAAEGD
jgi:hypothetical protein